jgi:thymidine phosphorylase
MPALAEARALAQSLVEVACAAGLPTVALLTDMDSVLGRTAGNALEVQEALDFLGGHPGAGGGSGQGSAARLSSTLEVGSPTNGRDPRVLELTLALAGECLAIGGLATDAQAGGQRAAQALQDGSAAEHFARMVAGLGGPTDVFRQSGLPQTHSSKCPPNPP